MEGRKEQTSGALLEVRSAGTSLELKLGDSGQFGFIRCI